MQEEKLEKRIIGIVVGIGLATVIGLGVKAYYAPRVYQEISKIHQTEEGVVLAKKHQEKQYLNPVDNINPLRDIDPFFDYKQGRTVTKMSEKNKITIQYSKGQATIESRDLFEKVEINSPVRITFAESYKIKKDRSGNIIDTSTSGYEIIDVAPIKKE